MCRETAAGIAMSRVKLDLTPFWWTGGLRADLLGLPRDGPQPKRTAVAKRNAELKLIRIAVGLESQAKNLGLIFFDGEKPVTVLPIDHLNRAKLLQFFIARKFKHQLTLRTKGDSFKDSLGIDCG